MEKLSYPVDLTGEDDDDVEELPDIDFEDVLETARKSAWDLGYEMG